MPLDQQEWLIGDAYIWAVDTLSGGQAVGKVTFNLDNGAVTRAEASAPLDFNGSFDLNHANSYSLNGLSNGQHKMVVVFYSTSNVLLLSVTIYFTTMNPVAPIVSNVPLVYAWLVPASISPAPIMDRNGQSVGMLLCQRQGDNIYVGLTPSLLLVGSGALTIQSTTGNNYGLTNNQKNAIGVAVPPVDSDFQVSAVFALPAFTNNNDEVQLWLGNDVDNFISLRLIRKSASTISVEWVKELFGVASTIASLAVQSSIASMTGADTVELVMKFNVRV